MRQMLEALPNPNIRITAVCDPNTKSDDYPEWGYNELNNKIRQFLGDPNWAKDARGGLCGREVGRDVVKRYYAKQSGGSPADVSLGEYRDFREMLETHKDINAVYNMTPEHLHGVVVMRALKAGKHVITHKPMANVLNEVRLLRDMAKKTDVATQLFCSAQQAETPRVAEWIAAGVIGTVREVVNVSTRPFWPQGMLNYPTDTPPVPGGFDWDLWLGPAAARPYHPAYTHAVFRGWYDFGTGALGDMGHYSFHQIFECLGLGSPLTVQASHSEYWAVTEKGWTKQVNKVSYPQSSRITWEFANPKAIGEKVRLHWYDGGVRPPELAELTEEENKQLDEYTLYIGDTGKILCDFMGGSPRLLPKARQQGFTEPPRTLPRPIGELEQFVKGCRGEAKPDAAFEAAYPFAETILLGTIALRVPGTLHWDTEKFEFTNSGEANALKYRTNRPGWEV
jgi:predicted dehydrogenase